MSKHRNILVAVDLEDNAANILAKAKSIADGSNAPLHVVHVFKPLGHSYAGALTLGRLEKDIQSWNDDLAVKVKSDLLSLTNQYQIDDDHLHIQAGHPASAIMTLAQEIGSDLIVVGKHAKRKGRIGGASTANYLLHHCKQDLLLISPDK
ncbi:MAG TPA: hypothetical protein DCZ03_01140 [Gammaproteobacteria bacterium]|nr:hypothetical protein [Gammaproteobacteria bacterium]